MTVRTLVRDCLFLNWALPADGLPEPPSPLRYELHSWQGRDFVFASAVLFHQQGVHMSALPLFRVSYPQLNLRLCVLDDEGIPSVLFRAMLMPAWMMPGVWLVAPLPARSARLDFPRPTRTVEEGRWRWSAERGSTLAVEASLDSPAVGEGPRFNGWESTLRYFRERPRGYAEVGGSLRRIETEQPAPAVWPVKARVLDDRLLAALLPLDGAPWPALHSSWLVPEIPVVFDLGIVPKVALAGSMPQPAASSRWAAARKAAAL